ncbi:MAG TPA: haloacid dehalogenase type II [Candidatus Limnocylindrales bacterium]|jgi:2-haloacid dehalogenase
MPLDFGAFDALTFDCYGTLIDWESGLLTAMRRVLDAHAVTAGDDDLLERYARHEAALEAGPYLRYRDVLRRALAAVAGELGVTPTRAELSSFGGSVGEWPAFPDTAGALARLQARFRLVVVTNCDNDLFAASSKRLGVAFDEVITAEQARSYKPSHHNFEVAFERVERLGVPRERILHVAQSLFHDHVPAQALGMTTVWVNRRHDRPGTGATPAAAVRPDLEVPDMATVASLAGV